MKHFSTKILFALLLAGVISFGLTNTTFATTGATFTTDVVCNGTNVNLFSDKDSVYLDGGPMHGGAAGLTDGY
ncbi:MAG TPA: hypothetical protein VF189_00715, partial [Patescibacteria group bacterium]